MKKIELLAPAGNFEALVAAVQNGADAVYFGSNKFNARMNTTNFSYIELEKAITYAKIRNVKTYLTLNTLMKTDELKEALELVSFCYQTGIDAIIVQDIGLASMIIKDFPDLPVHASTQMTIHNIEGVNKLEQLGFKRVVLSRELSVSEIKEICENTNMEIEVFGHGALCISYSGQCLMSSMIGARSGNRGKCAGPCRLPYDLVKEEEKKVVDKGYLLSSKDVCSLNILPKLINSGIVSLKLEGRMKSPEYVGIVTKIYRKYIDLVYHKQEYVIKEEDKEMLLQIFNRGGFSTGYLDGKLGKEMIYKGKPNHMGVPVGTVISYYPNKGYVTFKALKEIEKKDVISIQDNSSIISELMQKDQNIKIAKQGMLVTVGRIKGNIKTGDMIYRLVCSKLNNDIIQNGKIENRKRQISVSIFLKKKEALKIIVEDIDTKEKIEVTSKDRVSEANQNGLTKERIEEQIKKTGGTIFCVTKCNIYMDENSIIAIRSINDLRRKAIEELESKLRKRIKRKPIKEEADLKKEVIEKEFKKTVDLPISLFLHQIDIQKKYLEIEGITQVYVPIEECMNPEKKKVIKKLSEKFALYLYFSTITKSEYKKVIENILQNIDFKIEGFVLSNLSQLELVKQYNTKGKLEYICNDPMHIMNDKSINQMKKLGFSKVILSPEIDKNTINQINHDIPKEIMVYGRALLMISEYCVIGSYHKCLKSCNSSSYNLKDRLGYEFPVIANPLNCNNEIYNSKITSIQYSDLDIQSIRIDILKESIDEIKEIIRICKLGKCMEGKEYTNGNLNKAI